MSQGIIFQILSEGRVPQKRFKRESCQNFQQLRITILEKYY